jgi:hypothetical protein
MELVALSVALALAVAVLLRRPGVFAPALVFEGGPREALPPDDEDEQLPETDRAPRTPWLGWTVSGVAALRLALLLALHA